MGGIGVAITRGSESPVAVTVDSAGVRPAPPSSSSTGPRSTSYDGDLATSPLPTTMLPPRAAKAERRTPLSEVRATGERGELRGEMLLRTEAGAPGTAPRRLCAPKDGARDSANPSE